jgi:hypothetical protein
VLAGAAISPTNLDVLAGAASPRNLASPTNLGVWPRRDQFTPSTLSPTPSSDSLLNALSEEAAKTNEGHALEWIRQEQERLRQEDHRLQEQQAVQQQQVMAQQPPQMMQQLPMQQQMYQQPPPMMGQQPPQQVYGEPYVEYPVRLPPRVFDSADSYRSSHT